MPQNIFFSKCYLPELAKEVKDHKTIRFFTSIFFLNQFEYGDCSNKALCKLIPSSDSGLDRGVLALKNYTDWFEYKNGYKREGRLLIRKKSLIEKYINICYGPKDDLYIGRVVAKRGNIVDLISLNEKYKYTVECSFSFDVFLLIEIGAYIAFNAKKVRSEGSRTFLTKPTNPQKWQSFLNEQISGHYS